MSRLGIVALVICGVGLGVLLIVVASLFTSRPLVAVLPDARDTQRDQPPDRAVASLPEAAHRLELRGYRYHGTNTGVGLELTGYRRPTQSATYSATIVRYVHDDRLAGIWLYCRSSVPTFESDQLRTKVSIPLVDDAIALMGERSRRDVVRALDFQTTDLKETGGLKRIEGRAMTAEGWECKIVHFLEYFPSQDSHSLDDVAILDVILSDPVIVDSPPASALFEQTRDIYGTDPAVPRPAR